MSELAQPSELDVALRRFITDQAETLGSGAARVRSVWSSGAGWWFVNVEPVDQNAAAMSFAVMDDRGVQITVAGTCFEVYGSVSDSLVYLRPLIHAIFDGRVEEAGCRGNRFARIRTADRLWRVGAAHLPLPWSWRRPRRFAPYSAIP